MSLLMGYQTAQNSSNILQPALIYLIVNEEFCLKKEVMFIPRIHWPEPKFIHVFPSVRLLLLSQTPKYFTNLYL